MRKGPLTELKIVEFTGIGPVPYGVMVLADLGAQVIRIDRPGGYPAVTEEFDFDNMAAASVCNRSRPMVRVDLKSVRGREVVKHLIGRADGLVEGYRPGTMEKLGLGPDDCFSVNPRLAYVRMTGWGQDGPMARMAGHDLNYIGMSGALSLFARNGKQTPGIPPLLGDMAGGALFMVIGMLAAVLEAKVSGRGQIVDTAIVDGSANLTALLMGLNSMGLHDADAGDNMLDGGRHFYRTYVCSDGGTVAVGAVEPAFRRTLLDRLDLLDDPDLSHPSEANEAACNDRLAAIFSEKPRDHWAALFEDCDGCVTPVLDLNEAPHSAQAAARGIFRSIDGVVQPAPAPRFARTPGDVSLAPVRASQSDVQALGEWGLGAKEINALCAAGVIG